MKHHVFVTDIYILLSVSELTVPGTPLALVKCNDSEKGLNSLISYSITSGNVKKASTANQDKYPWLAHLYWVVTRLALPTPW